MEPTDAPTAAVKKRWLSRSVFGFGVASFLSDAGHEAATSALPALLLALGAPPAALGLIEGISDGAASFAKLAGGFWADRPQRRKPLVIAGYLLTGLAQGLYALVTGWPQLLAARGAAWLARGIRSPSRSAMLADAVPPEARGRAFGFHRAMDTAGAVTGPLLATLLVATLPLRAVFWWTMVPGLLAALAFALLVRPQRAIAGHHVRFWESLGALPAPFRRFLGAVFAFGLGDFARTLLILRAAELLAPTHGKARALAAAMLLYALHNVLSAAAAYPIGWLADRVDARRLLVVGYGLGVATAVLAAFATPSLLVLGLLFAAAGLTIAFEDTLESTVTAVQVPDRLRGTGYGVLATVNGVGDLLSSALVGALWTTFGARFAFLVAAALCAAGTLLLARDGRDRHSTQ